MPVRTTILAAALAAGLCGGCVTRYGNSPNSFAGGVGADALAPDLYRVVVAGNAYLSPSDADEMLRLKSAETALRAGRRFYAVETLSDESLRSRHYGVLRGGTLVDRVKVGSDKPRFVRTIHLLDDTGVRSHRAAGIPVLDAVFTWDELAPRVIGAKAPRAASLLSGGG